MVRFMGKSTSALLIELHFTDSSSIWTLLQCPSMNAGWGDLMLALQSLGWLHRQAQVLH